MDQTIKGFYPQTTIASGDLIPFYDINGDTGKESCNIAFSDLKVQAFASPTFTGVTLFNGGINLGTVYNLTIASGVLTITSGTLNINMDTEGGAATDDLTDITPLTFGQLLFIRTVNTNRDVVIKTTGNINIGSDISMANSFASIVLRGGATKWNVIAYYSGL